MKTMQKLFMALLVLGLVASPSIAVDYFSATGSGTTSVEVDIHSKAQPNFLTGKGQIIVTYLNGYSDLVGADLKVKGYIPDCVSSTVNVATASAQAVLTLASTTEFSAGDYIFIEDKADVNDFESAEISSFSTTEANVMTLVHNLSHGYPKGSKVWQIKDVANYEAFSATGEATIKENVNAVSVPAGSPLSVWLTGTAACRISVSGFKQ